MDKKHRNDIYQKLAYARSLTEITDSSVFRLFVVYDSIDKLRQQGLLPENEEFDRSIQIAIDNVTKFLEFDNVCTIT